MFHRIKIVRQAYGWGQKPYSSCFFFFFFFVVVVVVVVLGIFPRSKLYSLTQRPITRLYNIVKHDLLLLLLLLKLVYIISINISTYGEESEIEFIEKNADLWFAVSNDFTQ